MEKKKPATPRNPRTGAYTVHVPKDARTGTFASKPQKPGRIQINGHVKKAS